MTVDVRAAGAIDVSALLDLIRSHAEFERGRCTTHAAVLAAALDGAWPRLRAWIAERQGEAIGYATATIDHATWTGVDYLHLDCLFVRSDDRGSGVGKRLLDAVRMHASRCGLDELQWQTPLWNRAARRFYQREGAGVAAKWRFSLAID